MSNKISVEQALFGYHEGHNLIAASVSLTPKVRQFLSNVTDGSGSEKSSGFSSAITGLTVPDTTYYVLFCTWPAPEMSRPGCVWSHALLIDLADLPRISDLSFLKQNFRRPEENFDSSSYEKSVELDELKHLAGLGSNSDFEKAATLLDALYAHPNESVVMLDQDNKQWEGIIFAIWSQQWPRLRRSFAFSTGSLGDRRAGGLNFDLQIAPQGSQRLWRRNEAATLVIDIFEPINRTNGFGWMNLALEDLQKGFDSELRKFLFKYGSEMESPRASFSKLVELSVESEDEDEDESDGRLLKVARAFPAPDEAVTLKRDQLAQYLKGAGINNLDPALSAAHFLLSAKESRAFEKVPFSFGEYAASFWKHKRAESLALLGESNQSPRSVDFLDALSSVLKSEEVPHLWQEQPESLTKFIHRRPELAFNSNAWNLPELGQRGIWNALKSSSLKQDQWAQICSAMLLAQCSVFEHETISLTGREFPSALTRWLSDNSFRLPQSNWRKELEGPLHGILVEKDEVSVSIIALAAWALWQFKSQSPDGHNHHVKKLAREGLDGVPKILELPTFFWLTALGLQTGGRDGAKLLIRGYFNTYEAVAKSKYPGELWERLARILPEPKFGQGWDRCKLMRRGLRRWLHENYDLASELINSAPSAEHSRIIQKLLKD